MPDGIAVCAGCERDAEVATIVFRNDHVYCSEKCADMATSVLIRPQPKGVKAGCYDV